MFRETPEIVLRYDRLLAESTQEELEGFAYDSPAIHFGLYMEIQDKNGRWVRPTPNVLQLRISETITTLRHRCPGLRVRIIGVKPRRAGLSTFSLFCGYHDAMRRPIEGITIADCKTNSEMLIEKLGAFTSHDAFPWKNPLIRNPTGEFEWANGSIWTVDSAENPDAGVGGTRQFGHFSECSKFPQTEKKNDKKTMAAAMPSLNGDDTMAIAESTPEGATGWFYTTFDEEAMWLEDFLKRWEEGYRPEQMWIRVFAAWYEFADNARQNAVSDVEIAEIEATLSDIERDEREKYNLTYEQLAWRRDTITAECAGDPKIFTYYYPSDPVTCWITSGSPRFDIAKVMEMKRAAKHARYETGYLVRQDGQRTVTWSGAVGDSGEITMWEWPKEGMAYVVCCDPATGESQTVGSDPDSSSIGVWRQKYYDPDLRRAFPAKLVARVRGGFKGDNDIVAGHIDRLSQFYGRCICGLEVNQGLQVLRCLKDAGVPLYKRIVESHRTKTKEEQYGFKLTDANQRRMIIEGIAAAIRSGEIDISCPHMLDEMTKFVVKTNGRAEAASGAHDDDCFVAGTLVLTASGWRPIETLVVGEMVMTRDGFRPIRQTRTKIKPVIANLGLVGTATHPIITPNGEIHLTHANDKDSLFTWNQKTGKIEKQSFTEARNTTDTLFQNADSCVFIFGDMINGKNRLSRCIGRFGLILMEKFQQATLFITSTATRSITKLETLRACCLEITPKSTWKTRFKNQSCGKPEDDKPQGSSKLWPTGNKLQRGKRPCQNTAKSTLLDQHNASPNGERPTQQSRSTSPTEKNRQQDLSKHWQSGRNDPKQNRFTPQQPERRSSLSRVNLRALCVELFLFPLFGILKIALLSANIEQLIRKRLQRRRVYNLYVDGTHEYLANGILVHNCMMAAMAWEVLPSATVYARKVVRDIDPPDMAKPGRKTGGWRQVNAVKRGW